MFGEVGKLRQKIVLAKIRVNLSILSNRKFLIDNNNLAKEIKIRKEVQRERKVGKETSAELKKLKIVGMMEVE